MKSTGPKPPIKPRRILIADDDPLVAQTIRMALTVDGHSVEVAQDGEQALSMFYAGSHDLVITDFRMGKMDGLELAESIKRLAPATPVVLITAYMEAIKASMGKMGKVSNVDVLLGKPFSIMDLQAAVANLFPSKE